MTKSHLNGGSLSFCTAEEAYTCKLCTRLFPRGAELVRVEQCRDIQLLEMCANCFGGLHAMFHGKFLT